MSRRDAFDRILAALHEATFDDALWPAAAGLVDEACGIKGNLLTFGADAPADDVVIYLNRYCFRGERREEWERLYFDEYHHRDERLPRLRSLPDSLLVHLSDLFTVEEKKTSAVYNEALPLGGLQNGLTVRLDGPQGSRIFWTLGDPTSGNGWSFDEIGMIERLLPHLRQYVRTRQVLAQVDGLKASLATVLDTDAIGVIQLNRRGRVVEANDSARDMLKGRQGLFVRGGFLFADAPADNDRLQRLLARALPRFGGRGAGGAMVVRRPTGLPRPVVHVTPVGSRLGDVPPWDAAVLVLLVDPYNRLPVDPALVEAALDLLPAESRVAGLLAEGKSVREVAEATGRSVNTVRWHIRQIFEKHGLSRLDQLVQLVRSRRPPDASRAAARPAAPAHVLRRGFFAACAFAALAVPILLAGAVQAATPRDAADPTPATGEPTITGTPQIGFILAAHRGDIDDVNGTPARFPADYGFQWVRVNGSTETDINGATEPTYTLTAADEGRRIKVRVSFTDDLARRESRTSRAYPSDAVIALPPYPGPPRWVHGEGSGTAAIALTWAPPDSTWGWSVQGYEYRVRLAGEGENNWEHPTNAAELAAWPAIDTGWVTVPDSEDRGGGAGNEQRVIIDKLTASDTELTADADYYIQLRARTGGPRPVPVSLWDGLNGGIVQIRATAGGSAVPWLPIVYVPEDRDYITLTAQDLGGGDFRMLTVWSTPTRETGRVFYGGVPEFGIFGVPRAHIDRGHLKFQPRENFGGEGAQMLLTTHADAQDPDHWRMLRLEVQRTGTQTPVCARTKAVRDAIVRTLGRRDCGNVGHAELRRITELAYADRFALLTSSLAPGDFDGLTGLEALSISLEDATVTRLPTGLFSGLRRLEELLIYGDGKAGGLTVLQDGLLQGLESLTDFEFQNHADLATLGGRLFQDTPNLEDVFLSFLPTLGELPAGLLHGLTSLEDIEISYLSTLTAIPEGFFRDNPGLADVDIAENAVLATVPDDLFVNTPRITYLNFSATALTGYPDGFFEPLTMIDILELGDASKLTGMDPVIDPQDASGTVGTEITLDGNPQSTSPWGANLVWTWEIALGNVNCDTGTFTRTTLEGQTPSYTPTAVSIRTYRVTAKARSGRRLNTTHTAYDFSTKKCFTETITTTSGQAAAPSVSSVSVTAAPGDDNSWDAGDAVEAVLTFDENVTVDTTNGTPSVVVKLGEAETEKTADYASGSGTAALTFRYRVATGEGPYSEVLLEGDSLVLNGGAIQSTATQADVSLAHNGAGQAYPRSIAPDTKDPQTDDGPSAAFAKVPATHDGETAFTVELAFSAESSIASYVTVRDSLLEVTGGTVTRARRQTPGSDAAWVLTVRPDGSGDVTLTLPVRPCTAANAVCIGGKPIVRAATATVEGPPFTASFDGAPSEHDGSAFSYAMAKADGTADSVSVPPDAVTLNGGAIASTGGLDAVLTHAGAASVIRSRDAAGPALSAADAAAAEGGTLAFVVTLAPAAEGPVRVAWATADGTATAGSDYAAASGTLAFAAGETEATVRVAVTADGLAEGEETVLLRLSDADGAAIADGEATGTVAASAAAAGPVASFSNVPATHDGATAFEVGLGFSEATSVTSYVAVRDSLLEVTGGRVTRARRGTPGSDLDWILTVRPDGPGNVTLTLPVRDCGEANAVCAGGLPLAAAAAATVEGLPFTAHFQGAPAEHDGTAFTVDLFISARPEGLGYPGFLTASVVRPSLAIGWVLAVAGFVFRFEGAGVWVAPEARFLPGDVSLLLTGGLCRGLWLRSAA